MSDGVQIKVNRRAKAIINRLIADGHTTKEGMDWLTLATDPFHDTEIVPAGYPDLNTCNTIVQCFSYTASVSNALNASTAEKWDCHVFLNPTSWLEPALNGRTTLAPATIYRDGALSLTTLDNSPIQIYGGYNILTTGVGVDWKTVNVTADVHPVQGVEYPKQASCGNYRMIAAGFEVVNTTPELYRGGSVTTYRSPSQPCLMSREACNQDIVDTHVVNVNTYSMPPSTQALAQLYPTSKTWAAEKGVYSIATQSSDTNDWCTPFNNCPLWYDPPSLSEITGNTPKVCFTRYAPFASPSVGALGTLGQLLPFDTHGCIFTGLLPEATLQVTVKYYVERIPTLTEPDLLVLSRPPTPYDPLARELYTRVIQELSVGVPVGENPLGEWFNDVLDVVTQYAPSVGAVFGPAGQWAGKALGAGAGTLRKMLAPPPSNMGPAPPVPRAPPLPPAPRSSSLPKRPNNAAFSQRPKRGRGRRGRGGKTLPATMR